MCGPLLFVVRAAIVKPCFANIPIQCLAGKRVQNRNGLVVKLPRLFFKLRNNETRAYSYDQNLFLMSVFS